MALAAEHPRQVVGPDLVGDQGARDPEHVWPVGSSLNFPYEAPPGHAFAEYGRIARTEHLMRMVDPTDGTYPRQRNRQLTVQESRHKLDRDVCHGKHGTVHQAYRDGMDQLGALGLVLNAPPASRPPESCAHCATRMPPGSTRTTRSRRDLGSSPGAGLLPG
ncbi:Tn3 transposase DDE domain protein [Streptomyces sp. ADI91-18]|nr:Tn3 transposase DDE domain protein [Streptomyces sp. ADI91-18]